MNQIAPQPKNIFAIPVVATALSALLLSFGFDEKRWTALPAVETQRLPLEPVPGPTEWAESRPAFLDREQLNATAPDSVGPPLRDGQPIPVASESTRLPNMHSPSFTSRSDVISPRPDDSALLNAQRELQQAKAELDAEQAAYEFESNAYLNSAGTAGALGVHLMPPTPPSSYYQLRYNRALQEYRRLGGR